MSNPIKALTVFLTLISLFTVTTRPAMAAQSAAGSAIRLHTGTSGSDIFGYALSPAGDVNADGIGDYIIGSIGYAGFGGAATVFSGIDGTVLHQFTGPSFSLFGFAVAGAGDVDNDGFDDVVVSAPIAQGGGSWRGEVFVYSGATGSLLHRLDGFVDQALFGLAVLGAGDVDQDGHDDFVVSCPYAGNGILTIYSGMTGSVIQYIAATETDARFGVTLARLSDVTGNGIDEVIVGMPGTSKVSVFDLSTGDLIHVLSKASSGFGWAVANAGDTDGNGSEDILVGAGQADRAYLFDGESGANLGTLAGIAGSQFGASVAGAGDVNLDGYADVVIGSPEYGPYKRGRITVYSGLNHQPIRVINGSSDRWFGFALANVGDLDADGNSDFMASQLRYAGSDMGAAFLFSGTTNGAFALGEIIYAHLASPTNLGLAQVASADVNGDGNPDVISRAKTKLLVNRNNGAGLFGTSYIINHSLPLTAMSAGDIDRDGRADVVATTKSAILFYRSNGSTMSLNSQFGFPQGATSVLVSNFVGNSRLDLAVTSASDKKIRIYRGRSTTSNSPFAQRFIKTQELATGAGPIRIAVAKINGDSLVDLAVLNKSSQSVTVYLNDGSGMFVRQPRILIGGTPLDFAFADMNKDGRSDLLLLISGSNAVTVRFGNGTGKFGFARSFAAGACANSLCAGDLDRDGHIDVATANVSGNSVSVLMNDGTGDLRPPVNQGVFINPVSVLMLDVDRDADLDLISLNRGSGLLSVIPNRVVE